MSGALLSVENAVVDLPTPRGNLRAVDHVDLTVGEVVDRDMFDAGAVARVVVVDTEGVEAGGDGHP